MASQGIRLIGVNFKDERCESQRLFGQRGNPFMAVGYDPQGRAAINWGCHRSARDIHYRRRRNRLYRFAGPLVGSDYEQRFCPNAKGDGRKQIKWGAKAPHRNT